MTRNHLHHADPVSLFGGFLLFFGFLVTAFALIVGFMAASGFAVEQGATATQSAVDALAPYVTALALTGLVLIFLGIALDLRRMARSMYETAEDAVDAVDDLTQITERADHPRHVIPVVRYPEPKPIGHSAHEPTILPMRTPLSASTPAPAGKVSPAAPPDPGFSGTRTLRMPATAAGSYAPAWSGGPGAPPPGPEPGQQPPPWQDDQAQDRPISARPEPWRHSNVRVSRS